MKKLLMFGAIILNFSTFGTGREGGNGGDILICSDGKNYLLDIYQGIKDVFLPSIRSNENDSIEEMLANYSQRIAMKDTVRAKKFLSRALTLNEEINKAKSGNSSLVKFTSDELIDIDDSQEVFIPENCDKKQLVIQLDKNNRDVFGLKFRINRSYWDLLDAEQQMFTIAHEVLLEEAIEFGHTDSRRVREYNYLVGSNSLTKLSQKDYILSLKSHFNLSYQLDFNSGHGGLIIFPDLMNYYKDNKSLEIKNNLITSTFNDPILNFIVNMSWSFDMNTNVLNGNFFNAKGFKVSNGELRSDILHILGNDGSFSYNMSSKELILNYKKRDGYVVVDGVRIERVKSVRIIDEKIVEVVN